MKRADVIIVLGSGVKESKRRARYASEADCRNYILCGGKAKLSNFIEAEVMKEELMMNNIQENRIILENKSYDTKTNLENSLEILKNTDFRDIGIVTASSHMPRARRMAGRIFKEYNVSYYPVPIKTFKDFFIESKSVIWEIMASASVYGLRHYLPKT